MSDVGVDLPYGLFRVGIDDDGDVSVWRWICGPFPRGRYVPLEAFIMDFLAGV